MMVPPRFVSRIRGKQKIGGKSHEDIGTRQAAELNGKPSIILRSGDKAFLALFIALEQEKVREIRVISNPDKLQRL